MTISVVGKEKKMSKYILEVHYGLDHDHVEYVEMTAGEPLRVTLTKDPTQATYRSLNEAKKWAKDILKNGDGTSTWKIVVMPLDELTKQEDK